MVTATGAVSASSTALQAVLAQLGNELLSDVEGVGFTLLTGFFTAIKSNPSPQNVAAQATILVASALVQLPNLEQSGIAQLADAGLAAINALKPSASA
jgi:hypothetical protein